MARAQVYASPLRDVHLSAAADGIGGSIAAAIGTEDGRVVAHRPAALETRLAFLSVTNRVEPTLNYDVIRDGILPFLHQPVCRRVVCSGGSAPGQLYETSVCEEHGEPWVALARRGAKRRGGDAE